MEWTMLGQRANLYGVVHGEDKDHVKLNKTIWTVTEDPSDGYRSYLESITQEPADSQIGPFFDKPVATVTIREWKEKKEYADSESEGFELVDETGHVWLTIGTDNADDYYPSYTFWWQPKPST